MHKNNMYCYKKIIHVQKKPAYYFDKILSQMIQLLSENLGREFLPRLFPAAALLHAGELSGAVQITSAELK